MTSLESADIFKNRGNLIRKLRKKLRQIEKLERMERDLTEEEEEKIDHRDELRAELKSLLKDHDQDVAVLTENVMSVEMKEKAEIFADETCQPPATPVDVQLHCGDTPVGLSEGSRGTSVFDQSADIFGVHEIRDDTITKADQEETVVKPIAPDDAVIVETKPNVNITRKSLRDRKPKNPSASERCAADKNSDVTTPDQFFQNLNLKMDLLEGHHDSVCAVDFFQNFIVSGGRDTSLKLWSASSLDELKSFGGHNATITGVRFIKDQDFSLYPKVVTSSYDCSLRVWNLEEGVVAKSIYVYSPVTCLDYSNGVAAVGTEGGKMELYDIDSGEQLLSVKAHEDSVSAIKFLDDGKVASGSSDGLIKIYNRSAQLIFSLDPAKLIIKHIPTDEESVVNTKASMNFSKVNCLSAWKDLIIYGDDGHNVKVLDYKKGELLKLCNNLKEYSPTEALSVCQINAQSYLFCVGSDVDNGDCHINVRTLPDFRYLGTIRDSTVSSGAITAISVLEMNSRLQFVTGGTQLRVWDQVVKRGKKRKSSSECDSLISCKYVCQYNEIKESEAESEDDETTASTETSCSKENSTQPTNKSYCIIL